ncbi:MAG: hypothetical protein M4D80_41265 [Myxococcota bacterium]|nr:hypothetical protein [Myxococcota bacterium]
MTRVDAVREPLFDRHYYAPEEHLEDADDRAITFALAIIIAEWATGRFPYKRKFHSSGPLSGKHLKLALPRRLEQLLSRGMALDRAKRPRLVELVQELEAIAKGKDRTDVSSGQRPCSCAPEKSAPTGKIRADVRSGQRPRGKIRADVRSGQRPCS